ncbi:hypothetical protein SteCoe_11832 [Stentor coeruleus]|uniref:Uncharacterized protein n=1 Tax=Stentor coeruleus TaxID=5963 RepID=A0A1R2CC83_9CILI|nr:hypothetical protein SteCoe_11832 [Stentor coeruleus]
MMEQQRKNDKLSTNIKAKRKYLLSPPQALQSKNRIIVIKKRASKVVHSLQSTSWLSNTSSAQSLIIENPHKIHDKSFGLLEKHDSIEKLEQNLKDFLKTLEKLPNQGKKLKSEFKYYIETLKNLSKILEPYDKLIEKIALGLEKYIKIIAEKSSDDYKAINEKLMQKLQVLSSENIDFYKKNEELKKELSLVRKTVVFNEAHFAIESLLKELSVKSDYISKCNKEINEYKAREIQILKMLENRNLLSPDIGNESSSRDKKLCKRSQSIKNIPLISFKVGKI